MSLVCVETSNKRRVMEFKENPVKRYKTETIVDAFYNDACIASLTVFCKLGADKRLKTEIKGHKYHDETEFDRVCKKLVSDAYLSICACDDDQPARPFDQKLDALCKETVDTLCNLELRRCVPNTHV